MEHKQNAFRELRQNISGIWGDQSIIFRELGSKDPPTHLGGGGLTDGHIELKRLLQFPAQSSPFAGTMEKTILHSYCS